MKINSNHKKYIDELIDSVPGDFQIPDEYIKKYNKNPWYPGGQAWIHWFFDEYWTKIFSKDGKGKSFHNL